MSGVRQLPTRLLVVGTTDEVVRPDGCACEWTVGDMPCAIHDAPTSGANDLERAEPEGLEASTRESTSRA